MIQESIREYLTPLIKSSMRQPIALASYRTRLYKIAHQGKILILVYHRVLRDREEKTQLVQPGMYVTDTVFEKQIQFLCDNYEMVSFESLLKLWRDKGVNRFTRYCVITFDDGWADNYTCAFPILKRHHVPATIFLATSYIGTNQRFWTDKIAYLVGNVDGIGLSGGRRQENSLLLNGYGKIKEIVLSADSGIEGRRGAERLDAIIGIL